MSGKQKSTKILLLVLALLLVLVAVNQVSKSKKGERTFRNELISATPDEVTSLSLWLRSSGFSEVKLTRQGDDWVMKHEGVNYRADGDLVNGMIDELLTVKPERLVARTREAWGEYDVTDSTGIRVVLNSDKKRLGEIYIGRFGFNQATRKPTTYVRMEGDKETYAVEAYLSMTFSRDVEGLRDKSIFRGNRVDITSVTFHMPGDSSFTLQRDVNRWNINGIPADSAATINYLNSIAYTVGTQFRDDFAPGVFTGDTYKMVIDQLNLPPVEILAWVDEYGTILQSTANPDAFFDSGTANLFGKLFKGPGHFMAKE